MGVVGTAATAPDCKLGVLRTTEVRVLYHPFHQAAPDILMAQAVRMSGAAFIYCAKDVSFIAESSGLTRKGVQKALSEEGHPKFESVNAILHAMGYRLALQKL